MQMRGDEKGVGEGWRGSGKRRRGAHPAAKGKAVVKMMHTGVVAGPQQEVLAVPPAVVGYGQHLLLSKYCMYLLAGVLGSTVCTS